MSISLIIKGDMQEANAAARSRGVRFVWRSWAWKWGESYGECPKEDEAKVLAWFNEGKHVVPFPLGTLLHYSYSEDLVGHEPLQGVTKRD